MRLTHSGSATASRFLRVDVAGGTAVSLTDAPGGPLIQLSGFFLGGPPHNLFSRNVFDVTGEPPVVAAGIFNTGASIAVECGFGRPDGYGAGGDSSLVKAIHVVDVQVQIHRHGFGRIPDLNHGIADPQRCVHDLAVRAFERVADLYRIESLFEKIDDFVCAVDNKISIDRVKTFRPLLNWVRHNCSYRMFLIYRARKEWSCKNDDQIGSCSIQSRTGAMG